MHPFFLFLGGLFGEVLGEVLGRFWGGFGEVLGRFLEGFYKVFGKFSGVKKPIKNKEKRIKTYKPYKKDFPFWGLRKPRWVRNFLLSVTAKN